MAEGAKIILHPIERLRRLATPDKEVEEYFSDLNPAEILDSKIRDLFCKIVEQTDGPITLDAERLNTGTVKWEETTYNPAPGVSKRMITIWHEP